MYITIKTLGINIKILPVLFALYVLVETCHFPGLKGKYTHLQATSRKEKALPYYSLDIGLTCQ